MAWLLGPAVWAGRGLRSSRWVYLELHGLSRQPHLWRVLLGGLWVGFCGEFSKSVTVSFVLIVIGSLLLYLVHHNNKKNIYIVP